MSLEKNLRLWDVIAFLAQVDGRRMLSRRGNCRLCASGHAWLDDGAAFGTNHPIV